jgi:hypothetical protein
MINPRGHGFATALAKPFVIGDLGMLLGDLLD